MHFQEILSDFELNTIHRTQTNMETFLDSLKSDVQCSLCDDTLIEPKILECFHTYCKLCIKRHAELIDQVNVFKCPKCSAETSLPELNSVDDLKASLLHSRILKVLEFVEREKVCGVSESHSPASWHCFECDRSMCDECKDYHSVFIKEHKVVCLSELERENLEFMLTRENTCEYHSNQEYKFFCKDCDRCICIKCLETQQCRIHSTIPLQEQTSVNKAVMKKNLKLLEVKLNEIQKQVATLKDMTIKTRQNGERAKAKVRETMEQFIAALQENQRELVKDIEKRIEKAERMQMKGQCVLDQTRGAMDYLTKLIEKGLVSDMNAAKDIKGCHKSIDIPSKDESNFGFSLSKELADLNNAEIGTIRTMTDYKMSIVKVDSELKALKKAKLIVLTKTSTGELNDNPSDVVDVKVIPEDDVKIEKEYVTTGKTEVEFIPRVAGQLTAEVKVNGNHVSNSPLVMNVKPQQMKRARQFKIKRRGKDFSGITSNKVNTKIAITDDFSHCVHVFNTDGDRLLTYGSHGDGLGQLSDPDGLAFLNETNLVIADCGNDRICIVNTTTGTPVKTFGHYGNGNGEFEDPHGVHVDDDCNIIVSDRGNRRVQVFTRDGHYRYQFGLPEQDSFDPVSTVTHRGLFYVSDYNNDVIHVFEKKGDVTTRISTIGEQGSADGQLSRPWGLAVDIEHNLLVCDNGKQLIQKFTLDGRYVGKTCDKIDDPWYITVLNNGQFLVTSSNYGVYVVNNTM